MAAFGSITIADGQSTPANHTFTAGPKLLLPDGQTRYSWFDFSVNNGVMLGANKIEMDVRMPSSARAKSRVAGDVARQLAVAYKITLPTLETLSNNTASGINPQPTWAYDTVVWVKVLRNGRAAQDPVKDALAFMRNLSSNAQFTDTVLSYAPPQS